MNGLLQVDLDGIQGIRVLFMLLGWDERMDGCISFSWCGIGKQLTLERYHEGSLYVVYEERERLSC